MRTLIAAPFVDSRAADLSLVFGLEPLPALGVHVVQLPGVRVELRVLGASHQVLLDAGGARWSETVACLPDRPGALPEHDETPAGALESHFDARCEQLDPAGLAARVRELRVRCDGHPRALVGAFPGSPLAVTAMLVDPVAESMPGRAGVGWRTWHAYPQTGELVATRSVLVPRSADDR